MKFLANQTPRRISAVVSKSVAKKAIKRNSLRRAVYRALCSPTLSNVAVSGTGCAVVFVQKIPTKNLTETFAKDLVLLFNRIQ